MKLSSFQVDAESRPKIRFGALMKNGTTLVSFADAAQALDGKKPRALANALAFLEGGPKAKEQASDILERAEKEKPSGTCFPVDSVSLLAPVPRPVSIRDCLAFEKHLNQSAQTVIKWRSPALAAANRLFAKYKGSPLIKPPKIWYKFPVYYTGNPMCMVGPDHDIQWPSYSKKLDYELEMGIYIGKQGKNIPRDEAASYIAGYTIFNDFSARDMQMREMAGRLGPAKGKNFDTSYVTGPWLVTPDEIPNPYNLTMIARVNGEEWSRGNSGEMYHKFEDMIRHISQDETLYPGELIGSGTVGGGCGLELDRWLSPGDVVELEIEGLGVLKNRIVRPAD
ncbi:Fumarylacetoacetate (FAA) hydrolase family protein [Desulfatibacillum alkenivorans DSM 16219]|jgi:2-keto-4-pentenoate hydratase/2-oxohepta-3-ene-1,7-dioic acid hydratase in catechol pathway|uniref:Fumarylacetoacetate (FAA) hydrolase family protein n=1 Tax=Desulfatibacillum alkenivorans DSM 16219 TaxID=1121393 RepID=A0A1M6QAU8_9BACT|nr:fumarylacetoacetate hydrolase family protein [Desulfatibacillum alkenivorans]SHK17285.1 Fumarylacetoacetate (FAA) hydrolase family protein [Desulfatibacillum alkenivorans DSM 16219]